MPLGLQVVLLLCFSLAWTVGRAEAQSCPADQVRLDQVQYAPSVTASYFVPSLDTLHVECFNEGDIPPNCLSTFQGRIRYDWRSGSFRVWWDGYLASGSTWLTAQDRFEIVGLTAPADIRVRLTGQASVLGESASEGTSYGILEAALSTVGGPRVTQEEWGSSRLRQVPLLLETVVHVLPEGTFVLTVELTARTYIDGLFAFHATADGSGTLSFLDLPAGASLRSCKGFGEAVTRATRTSWGRLKAMYR